MNTILITKKAVLDIKKNEDGTLLISNGDGLPVFYAGSLIKRFGGIEELLSSCVQTEKTATEIAEQMGKQRAMTVDERNEQKCTNDLVNRRIIEKIKSDYEDMIKKDVIQTNIENISILLNYLNLINWGSWDEFPKMAIGYSCNQYDCNGNTATSIILNSPIEFNGKLINKFEVGAPKGFLPKYTKIR